MILSILVCLLAMFGLQWLFPAWWWIMAVPFVWCLFKADSGWRGFLIGMLSAGILWLGGGLFYLTTCGELIARRVATMLQIDSPWILVVVMVLIAAVAGGLAGYTGGLLRAALRPGK